MVRKKQRDRDTIVTNAKEDGDAHDKSETMTGNLSKNEAHHDDRESQATVTDESAGELDIQSDEQPDQEHDQGEVDPQTLLLTLTQVAEERDQAVEAALRLRADFENFRRRSRQETEVLKTRAAADLVESLLPVIDNMERALAAVGQEDQSPLAQGVQMVFKQLLQTLEKAGLQPIESVGAPFNPHFHEAVAQEPSDDIASGSIIDEYQRGYMLGDYVLRPSIVKVAE